MGAALARAYAPRHEVLPFRRDDLDITRADTFEDALSAVEFDVLVYTAGVTNVDHCEDNEAEAFAGNATAPGKLAEICAKRGVRMIHVSTDYVFDGDTPGALDENAPAHPVSVYGASKLAGEKAVLTVDPSFLVIRVSWLFGLDRPSFPDMLLGWAKTKDRVEAISDKISCPTYSEDLAVWIEPMLTDTRYQGVLHLSNSGETSWQDYGQATLDIAEKIGVQLKTNKVHGQLRSDLKAFKAVRPQFTAFDTGKFQSISGTVPHHWKDALEEYLRAKYP